MYNLTIKEIEIKNQWYSRVCACQLFQVSSIDMNTASPSNPITSDATKATALG
jgi:hypothetical protein